MPKANKPIVKITAVGYEGTHPEVPITTKYRDCIIHKLTADANGIDIYNWEIKLHKKDRLTLIHHFDWSEIIDFDYGAVHNTHKEDYQRYTATRVALFGLFALAIPKTETRKVVDESYLWMRLVTTTGIYEARGGDKVFSNPKKKLKKLVKQYATGTVQDIKVAS